MFGNAVKANLQNNGIDSLIKADMRWLNLNGWVEEWKHSTPTFCAEYSHNKDLNNFGGNANAAFKRDGYKCAHCGTRRDLLIHHLDGKSVYSKNSDQFTPNNAIENFLTLCFFCHKKIHNRFPVDIYDAIRHYISFFKDAIVLTPSKEPATILEHHSGSVFSVNICNERTVMFLLSDLLFPEGLIEQFIKYVKMVYENHCFNCKADVSSHTEKKCAKCGWYICSACGHCGCLYGN